MRSLWILLCAPTSEVTLNTSAPRHFSPFSPPIPMYTPRNLKRLGTEARKDSDDDDDGDGDGDGDGDVLFPCH